MEHHHEHNHTGRNLTFTVLLNLVITVGQFVGGFISGSLALISDALHNLSDVIAVVLAYVAHRVGLLPQTSKSSFGYKRAEILAAFINSLALIAVSVYLLFEAFERFRNPKEVGFGWMFALGFLGFLANTLSVFALHHDKQENLNIRAAYIHLIGDAMTSVAVMIGAVCIWLWNIYWIDPLVTVVISLYIFVHTVQVLKESVEILMQFAPSDIDQEQVVELLDNLDHIERVYHIHLWRLSDRSVHFEAHIVLSTDLPVSDTSRISEQIKQILMARFKITHVTLQFEYPQCPEPGNC
jgi:cobalt-zinc-cadmium efflux system protein